MVFARYLRTCLLGVVSPFLMPISGSTASTYYDSTMVEIREFSFPLLCISLVILLFCIIRLLQYRRDLEKRTVALKESEERYALALDGANDGLWDWNLKTDGIYFSSRWKSMVGYQDDEMHNEPGEWFSKIHPDDIKNLQNSITAHLKGLTDHFENQYRIKHKNGAYIWMLCRGLAVRNEEGEPVRMAGSQTDINDRKRTEDQLIYDAFHDSLTGLPNRSLFIDHLEISFARKRRKRDYQFALLFLDLDRFKNINDSFGHLFGNRLLEETSKRLGNNLREGDTFARFGGDEFAILLDDISDAGQAISIAERIGKELSSPFSIDGQEVFVSASIGIATSRDYHRSEDILRDADIAMYRAKFNGKGCYAIFDEHMRDDVINVLQLETDLRNAVNNQDFMIYYQPIVSLDTQGIIGFEALLRWYNEKRGFIPPSEFIPLAEETGLIIPIGEWVLREACRQLSQWQKQFPLDPPLTISVNVSIKQFSRPDFIRKLKHILDQTGLNPKSLILEVTESCIMDNAKISSVLMVLKDMDIKIHIDDFGTGYSSLSYIHKFPVSALKIDRSFINKMGLKGEDSEIVNAIVNMAQNLNIDVIAEGVEKDEHIPILQALKCKYVQGYFFSHPLNSKQAEECLLKLSSKLVENP